MGPFSAELTRHGYICGELSCVFEVPMSNRRAKYVIGPDGAPLTIADLPDPKTQRWVVRRKAQVVAAVAGGLLTLEEACSRYRLTVDEFLNWQQSINRHGLAGLRTTKCQEYRQPHEPAHSQSHELDRGHSKSDIE